jgi:hypothetical protein
VEFQFRLFQTFINRGLIGGPTAAIPTGAGSRHSCGLPPMSLPRQILIDG